MTDIKSVVADNERRILSALGIWGEAVLPIDQIIVGDRTVGLLNPITVDENGRLLAGARRLAACKRRERPLRGQR